MTDISKGDRLAKVIAHAGICSRRQAEQLILDGRVQVDGKTILTPAFTVTSENKVVVNGKPIKTVQKIRLWKYYKPAGVLCARADDFGRQTLADSLAKFHPYLPRVVSVGRLDLNSEGLLLLTNYGPLARYFELPAHQFKRTYRVRIYGDLDPEKLAKLSKGITVEGVRYGSIKVTVERQAEQGKNHWIIVELMEGKNREIRKVMNHLGYQVNRLIRQGFGPYKLGNMKLGDVEEVTVPEDILKDVSTNK